MPTVGEILRSEREKKGLTIKDIEKATSIRALYLNAIEEDNYGIVPGEVYLKGFIRNYATYLGLDSQDIMKVYKQSRTPVIPESAPAPAEKNNLAKAADKADSFAKPEEKSTGRSGAVKWIGTGVVIAVLLGGGWWWAEGQSGQNQPPAHPSPVVPAPVRPAAPQTPAGTAPPAQNSAAKPVAISVKYTDACWTLVKADGKEVYEGIPKIGETLTWDAQTNINIQFGNAGAVEVVYNGQPLGKMGGKGEVVSKSFSANAAKQ